MLKILISILLLGSFAFCDKINYTSYEKALEIAKKEDKIIMIELIKDNCSFCKKMEQEVLVEEKIVDGINSDFIPVLLNVDKDELPLGLEKGLTPTFAFVNKEGELFSVIPGAWKKEDFLDLLKYIKKKSKLKRELKE